MTVVGEGRSWQASSRSMETTAGNSLAVERRCASITALPDGLRACTVASCFWRHLTQVARMAAEHARSHLCVPSATHCVRESGGERWREWRG
jgi:hypothetical protein